VELERERDEALKKLKGVQAHSAFAALERSIHFAADDESEEEEDDEPLSQGHCAKVNLRANAHMVTTNWRTKSTTPTEVAKKEMNHTFTSSPFAVHANRAAEQHVAETRVPVSTTQIAQAPTSYVVRSSAMDLKIAALLAGKNKQNVSLAVEFEDEKKASNSKEGAGADDDSSGDEQQNDSVNDGEEEKEVQKVAVVTAKKAVKVATGGGRQRAASDPTVERVDSAPLVLNELKTRGGGYQIVKPAKKIAIAQAHLATAVMIGSDSESDEEPHWADEKATGGGNVWLYDSMFFD
jgi:hypothetical protein